MLKLLGWNARPSPYSSLDPFPRDHDSRSAGALAGNICRGNRNRHYIRQLPQNRMISTLRALAELETSICLPLFKVKHIPFVIGRQSKTSAAWLSCYSFHVLVLPSAPVSLLGATRTRARRCFSGTFSQCCEVSNGYKVAIDQFELIRVHHLGKHLGR